MALRLTVSSPPPSPKNNFYLSSLMQQVMLLFAVRVGGAESLLQHVSKPNTSSRGYGIFISLVNTVMLKWINRAQLQVDALPCSHAQQQHSSSSVQARCLSFASEPLPEDLYYCGLQIAAAPEELLHLNVSKTTPLHIIHPFNATFLLSYLHM